MTLHFLGFLMNRIKADFEPQGTQTSRLQLDEVSALNDLYHILVRVLLFFHILP